MVDPRTRETHVLPRQEVYERVRQISGGVNDRAGWDDPAFDGYDRLGGL